MAAADILCFTYKIDQFHAIKRMSVKPQNSIHIIRNRIYTRKSTSQHKLKM